MVFIVKISEAIERSIVVMNAAVGFEESTQLFGILLCIHTPGVLVHHSCMVRILRV